MLYRQWQHFSLLLRNIYVHIAGNIENILPTNISLHAKQVIVVGLIAIIPPKNFATPKETMSRDFLSSGFCMNHLPQSPGKYH